MNERGGRFYATILPTDYKIIFFLGGGIKLRRYFFEFCTKILKISPDVSKSIGTSVGKKVLEHGRIGLAASVGNCADRPGSLTVARIGMCTIRW
jgi:hypothetical protein